MNNPQLITKHTLNEAWLEACKTVFMTGTLINADQKQKEITNLHIKITNSFETHHDVYFKYFSKSTFEQVLKVYSKGGSEELKKDYWTQIYNNKGIDQVVRVIDVLKTDPLSKSATIVLSDIQKDKQPCVMDVNFRIREEKVEMTVVFKSSDVAKKFIPDIVVLSRIHEQISRDLHLARGGVDAFILSAQLHENDFDIVKRLIKNEVNDHYYDVEKVIDNWNGDARDWDQKIKNPEHYVNIENGYSRFLKFSEEIVKNHITKNQTVLDSGCGTGIIARQVNKYSNNVYGIDIADRMIEVARRKNLKASFVLGNCLDIPFEDKFFNAVVTRGVLITHVGKDYSKQFIEEAKRVLIPGGLLVFDFVTHYNKGEEEKFKQKAVFNQKQIMALLEKSGFRVIEFSGEEKNRVNAVACIKE